MILSSEKEFSCPYCAQPNTVVVEGAEGREYKLVTDCEVCCRPIVVHARIADDDCELDVHGENE